MSEKPPIREQSKNREIRIGQTPIRIGDVLTLKRTRAAGDTNQVEDWQSYIVKEIHPNDRVVLEFPDSNRTTYKTIQALRDMPDTWYVGKKGERKYATQEGATLYPGDKVDMDGTLYEVAAIAPNGETTLVSLLNPTDTKTVPTDQILAQITEGGVELNPTDSNIAADDQILDSFTIRPKRNTPHGMPTIETPTTRAVTPDPLPPSKEEGRTNSTIRRRPPLDGERPKSYTDKTVAVSTEPAEDPAATREVPAIPDTIPRTSGTSEPLTMKPNEMDAFDKVAGTETPTLSSFHGIDATPETDSAETAAYVPDNTAEKIAKLRQLKDRIEQRTQTSQKDPDTPKARLTRLAAKFGYTSEPVPQQPPAEVPDTDPFETAPHPAITDTQEVPTVRSGADTGIQRIATTGVGVEIPGTNQKRDISSYHSDAGIGAPLEIPRTAPKEAKKKGWLTAIRESKLARRIGQAFGALALFGQIESQDPAVTSETAAPEAANMYRDTATNQSPVQETPEYTPPEPTMHGPEAPPMEETPARPQTAREILDVIRAEHQMDLEQAASARTGSRHYEAPDIPTARAQTRDTQLPEDLGLGITRTPRREGIRPEPVDPLRHYRNNE